LGLDLNVLIEQEEERDWATAAWGVWPPASWIRWRTLDHNRQSASASVTNTEFSTSRFATAGRWSRPDKWLRLGNPWALERPRMRLK